MPTRIKVQDEAAVSRVATGIGTGEQHHVDRRARRQLREEKGGGGGGEKGREDKWRGVEEKGKGMGVGKGSGGEENGKGMGVGNGTEDKVREGTEKMGKEGNGR